MQIERDMSVSQSSIEAANRKGVLVGKSNKLIEGGPAAFNGRGQKVK